MRLASKQQSVQRDLNNGLVASDSLEAGNSSSLALLTVAHSIQVIMKEQEQLRTMGFSDEGVELECYDIPMASSIGGDMAWDGDLLQKSMADGKGRY